MTSFYSEEELAEIGFSHIGENVLISKKTSFYGVSRISIGDNVRIDDFCVISAGKGGIEIGNYVHIAVFCSLMGDGKIILSDFSGLSSRVSIYSSSDDYKGFALTNPTIPDNHRIVDNSNVTLGKHVVVGSGTVILPGTTIEEGVAIGALSLVRKNCKAFKIYAGNPLKELGNRNKKILELEHEFLNSKKQ